MIDLFGCKARAALAVTQAELELTRADSETGAARSRELMDGAMAELHETRMALDLERTKRISAEALAESYRQQAERSNELARKMEDDRAEAVKSERETLLAMNRQLIDGATPKDDPRAIENLKDRMKQLPHTQTANPLHKTMRDFDAAFIQKARSRTGIPSVDIALNAANATKNEPKPN